MPLFGAFRSKNARSKKRAANKGGGGGTAAEGKGIDLSMIPLPFPIPNEAQWLLQQWDLETVIGRSHALYKRFLSLPRETQSLLSWGFLLFTIFFVSGLWTLKLGFFAFLLLFRPFEDPEKRKQRLAGGGRKGKMPSVGLKATRGKQAQGFSDDPLISALQRIPETYTFGNVPPSSADFTGATPTRKASCPPIASSAHVTQAYGSVQQRAPSFTRPSSSVRPTQSPRSGPGLHHQDEPLPYDSSSSTDSKSSVNRRGQGGGMGLGLGPAPNRIPPQGRGMPGGVHRAVTAPHQANSHAFARSPASLPPLSQSPAGLEERQEEKEETEWERQQRQVLMLNGGVRHKSASFHRLEQAQKFWNRKFSSSSHHQADGDGTDWDDIGDDVRERTAEARGT